MNAQEKREQAIQDGHMAEMIQSWLTKQYQQAYPTNGCEEQDLITAEMTIRAAYKLIAQNRARLETIKTRMAFAVENNLPA